MHWIGRAGEVRRRISASQRGFKGEASLAWAGFYETLRGATPHIFFLTPAPR